MIIYYPTDESSDLLLDTLVTSKEVDFLDVNAFMVAEGQTCVIHVTSSMYLSPEKVLVGVPRKTTIRNILLSSMVFERGNLLDLMYKDPYHAMLDLRLTKQGKHLHWKYQHQVWSLDEPFLAWLYLKSFQQSTTSIKRILDIKAFADTKNGFEGCAKACALAVSLYRRGLLHKLSNKKLFLEYLAGAY